MRCSSAVSGAVFLGLAVEAVIGALQRLGDDGRLQDRAYARQSGDSFVETLRTGLKEGKTLKALNCFQEFPDLVVISDVEEVKPAALDSEDQSGLQADAAFEILRAKTPNA